MNLERRIEARGDDDSLREGIRAYFLGEGYQEEARPLSEDAPQVFSCRPEGLSARLASRIELLPRRVTLRFGPRHEDGRARSVWLAYEVATGWRLTTRLDLIFFRLEALHLERYLETGQRGDTRERLDRLRRPISTTIMTNVVLGSLMIALVGRFVGFSPPLLIGAAVIVALVNMISIMGFADVVIEGMEKLEA